MFDLPKPWSSILRFLCSVSVGLAVLFTTTSRRVQGQQGRNETRVQVNQVQGTEPVQAFVEDEFIVVLKRAVRAGFRTTQGPSNRPAVNVATLQQLIDRHGVARFRRQFATARPRPQGSASPDLTGHFKVRIPRGVSLDVALVDFANDPNVERVEKIGIHPVFITPNDSFYPDQWQHHAPSGIDSNLAWERRSGNPSVVVAVLDTGVHHNHPDLNANVWVNPREIPNNGIDDDNNGYIDDTRGYDFVESATGASSFTCCDADCGTADNDPSDHNGHGTHLAGIVAAVTNNGIGVSGIAGGFGNGTPQSTGNGVRIMPLRVGWNGALLGLLCGNGLIRMDYAAEALHYVAAQKAAGVNIAAVNCSWGSSDSGGFGAAVDEVLASDVMVIHAAGNSGNSTADYLGSKVGVMSVAATDQNGAGASFTNFGDYVEISAPGVDILSTWVGPDPNTAYYATASGTSMATPHASAVAGLLESFNSGLTGPQKFGLMVSSTKPYVNDGRNLGSGILNANLALGAAGPATPDFLVSASPGNRLVVVGGGASYDVTATALSGFSGTIDFGASGLPFGAAASFSPGSVVGSGTSTMTVTTGPGTPVGSYPITITATGGGLSHTANVTLIVYIPGAALFVKTDTATQGTWKGTYGAQGYAIANDATNYPAYAEVMFSGQGNHTWAGSTTDVRALQKAGAADRIASTWHSTSSSDIDINLIDSNWHQVALYCVDWDNSGRSQQVEVLDAVTGNVLDTLSVATFTNGRYGVWNLRGHVKIRVTKTAGYNGVASGIFFDVEAMPDFALSASPATNTVVAGNPATYSVAVSSLAGFTGSVSLSASGLPPGATASFNPNTVPASGSSTLTLATSPATPGGSYSIAIGGTSGGLSHSVTVTLLVTVSVPAAATYLQTDTGTKGSWKGIYGADGYVIANDSSSYPAYAQVTLSGQGNYTWAASTTDVRALQKADATDRIASTWHSTTSFDIDVNLSDGSWHRVAIYCLDWDNGARTERIDVLDAATGGILSTRSVAAFYNGQYLIWNLRGHIKIRVTKTAGYNGLTSGIFFDPPAAADFGLAVNPSAAAAAAGSATSYTVTVTSLAGFDGTVSLAASGLPSGATAGFNPASVTSSGSSTLTISTSPATPGGSHTITVRGQSGALSHSLTVSLMVSVSVAPAGALVQVDTGTQGTWKGTYGFDGYLIANDATNLPAYAQLTLSGQGDHTWVGSTTEVRALQKASAADRIASTWHSTSSFDIDINLSDGNWHQVAVYSLDWENTGRSQRVDVLDATSGNVMATRNVTAFSSGQYVVWNLRGHVKLRVTKTAGYNCVLSGIFFDPAQPNFSLGVSPALVSVAAGEDAGYTVQVSVSANFSGPVGLSVSGLPPGARASFSPTLVSGSGSSALTISTSSVTPGGSYPINVSGTSSGLTHSETATILVIASVPAGAAFLRTDVVTKGSWKGVFGSEGYAIANNATNYPAYAQVNFTGQADYTWVASTTDPRALQKAASTDRIASTWHSTSTFYIDIDLADGNWHQVAVYCLDWDNNGRVQTVEVLDATTGSILDSRTVSAFSNGMYLVWNLRGHIKIRVTKTSGYNSVMSGLFFH
jgi:subtilisin family serine protease/uncharacterized membrane protein YkoI